MSSVHGVAHVFELDGEDYEYIGPSGADGLPVHAVRCDIWKCQGCGMEILSEMFGDFDERTGRTTDISGLSDPRYRVISDSLPPTCPLGMVHQVMES